MGKGWTVVPLDEQGREVKDLGIPSCATGVVGRARFVISELRGILMSRSRRDPVCGTSTDPDRPGASTVADRHRDR